MASLFFVRIRLLATFELRPESLSLSATTHLILFIAMLSSNMLVEPNLSADFSRKCAAWPHGDSLSCQTLAFRLNIIPACHCCTTFPNPCFDACYGAPVMTYGPARRT